MKFWTILAATTIFAASVPALAQTEAGKPAFRVPIGGTSSSTSGPATYAWMQTVGTCSNACGTGSRATTYQCQNVNDYDFGGSGYGAPEADSFCSASGPRPSSTSAACTNFSGCSYDWVKPPVSTTIVAKPDPSGGTYPLGAIGDCSYAKRVFAPYCQRAGSPAVTMSNGDHAFCSNDRPDYNDVANGVPDALGYDRTTEVISACVPGSRDYAWKTSAWTAGTNTCSTSNTETRTVQCVLKFNGSIQPDSNCAGITKPAETQPGAANYSSCTYSWDVGGYGAYSSTCSDSATRTRTVTCRRSNGDSVADSQCSGTKPATSETGPNTSECGYAWTTPTEWSYADTCSSSTTRTRSTSCRRSDGKIVADGLCTAAKPSTSESGVSNFASCTYTPRDQGKTACTAQGTQQQYWDCTRSDGQTGFPASYCGKTNPENLTCTPPPPVYTYTPQYRGETACSASQKQVYWDCTRNDGATGFPASNCGKTNPETQSCVMPVTYSPRNRGETACSGGQKQVYWDCLGSDGSVAPASSCGKTSPETQGCVMPVTYTPRYQGESACSNSQKQVYWDCAGSDGSSAPASACGKTSPETQSCTMPVTYSWQTGGWSGYNSTCSDSATRTRSVWCQGSDGSRPGDAPCGGARPSASETTGIYSSCGYTSVEGQKSACTNGTATTPLQCRRSDGVYVANSFCGTGNTKTESCSTGQPNGYCLAAYTEMNDMANVQAADGYESADRTRYNIPGPIKYGNERFWLHPETKCSSGYAGWGSSVGSGFPYGGNCWDYGVMCMSRQ